MKSIFVCEGRCGTMHFNHKGYNVTSKQDGEKKIPHQLKQLQLSLQHTTTVQMSSSVKIFTTRSRLAKKKSKIKKQKKHRGHNIF